MMVFLLGMLVSSMALPPRCVVIVSNSDLHGAIEPYGRTVNNHTVRFGGLLVQSAYIDIFKRTYGDRLLVVDAGDLFQGTLASNLSRGKAIIDAYNAIGVTATAIGNHEFDFGPLPFKPQDPLGTLKLRIHEAHFPFLALNIVAQSPHSVRWKESRASILVDAGSKSGGLKVGLMGISTVNTPSMTRPSYIAGLRFVDPKLLVVQEAKRLRHAGADLVVLLAHMGGRCTDWTDPKNNASCMQHSELFELLRSLPLGTLDVAVGGHTHGVIAHYVAGVAVIQAAARGKQLGSIRACAKPKGGLHATRSRIYKPITPCFNQWHKGGCGPRKHVQGTKPATFLGQPVVVPRVVANVLEPYLNAARTSQHAPIGVTLSAPLKRTSGTPSLGMMIAKAMLVAAGTDVALQNLGGVRADIPAGVITYGHAFEALPFGNQLAVVTLTGEQLLTIVNHLVGRHGQLPYMAGLRCAGVPCGSQQYPILLASGAPLDLSTLYNVAVSDYLLDGGEGLHAVFQRVPPHRKKLLKITLRDALIQLLKSRMASPPG